MEEIKITCKGSDCVPIVKLENFQGNLKTLEQKQLEKLKSSIIKYGFSFPVVVWGKKIIDGHQRIFATKELLKESYTIGDIPIVEIEAKNKKEAAEKLLVLNSHYAKMTDSGLHDFVNDFDINIEDMPELELPDISNCHYDIEMLDSDGETMSGANYGDIRSDKIPVSIMGIGGMINRDIMEKVKKKLTDKGADENEDNADLISEIFLRYIS